MNAAAKRERDSRLLIKSIIAFLLTFAIYSLMNLYRLPL
jgi:hypothetical protein